MAEQHPSTPTKPAEDVRKSESRAKAEDTTSGHSSTSGSQGSRSESKGSKYTASQDQTWHSPAHKAQAGSTKDVHPMTGKSLEYSSGQGREAFVENHYATDSVNQLDHLSHTMVPRNQFD